MCIYTSADNCYVLFNAYQCDSTSFNLNLVGTKNNDSPTYTSLKTECLSLEEEYLKSPFTYKKFGDSTDEDKQTIHDEESIVEDFIIAESINNFRNIESEDMIHYDSIIVLDNDIHKKVVPIKNKDNVVKRFFKTLFGCYGNNQPVMMKR